MNHGVQIFIGDYEHMTHPELSRNLTLPWLVFYGLGVTVGAGVFALIGEIVRMAGDAAPLSFLLAGAIAAATGWSYALLIPVFPKAGGEAVFVNRGMGNFAGRLAGIGVAATGMISSAAIAHAFAGYAGTLIGLPPLALTISLIILLSLLAWWGVRESVVFAATITVIEIGTLLVIIFFGLPVLQQMPIPAKLFGFENGLASLTPVLSAAVIAFFAFVGFEDIVNMAEETVDAERAVPRAIFWTLGVTIIIYILLSLIAVSMSARTGLTHSPAPLAFLFEQVTGMDGRIVSLMAAIAMVNGILVQLVMSARVLYGMANESLIPAWFGAVDPVRHTPARATFLVALITILLAAALPLVKLAELTSLVILAVFALVNLSLFRLGRKQEAGTLRKWRYWGIFACSICIAILIFHIAAGLTATH